MQKVLVIILIMIMFVSIGCFFLSKKNQSPSENIPIKLGYLMGTEAVPILVAKNQGFFTKEGLDVKFFNLEKQRGIEYSLIGAGVLDGAATGKMRAIRSVSEDLPLKIVGNLLGDGGQPVFTLAVKENSGISSLNYFEGKEFGLYLGSSTEYVFDKIMAKHNVEVTKVKIIPLPFAEQISAFRADKIKAIIADPVVIGELEKDFQLKPLAVSTEVIPNSCIDGVIFSDEFINNNPQLVARFMKAIFKANKFINQKVAEDPSTIKAILKQEDSNTDWSNIPLQVYAVDNKGLTAGVEEILRWMLTKNYLKKNINPDAVVYNLGL